MEMPQNMHGRIMAKIMGEQIKIAKRKLAFFVFGSLASLGLFVASVAYAVEQFAQSDFPHYVSLIYSDTSLLTLYWKDLAYSFTESIPLVSIVLFLLAAFVLALVLRKTMQNFGREESLQKNLIIA